MKASRIDLNVSTARFLRIKETFAVEGTDATGSDIEVRIPLEGVGKIIEAMAAAQERGSLSRDRMPTSEAPAIATQIEITPLDGFGVRLAIRMQDDAWAEFLVPSRRPGKDLENAAKELLAAVGRIAGD